MNCYDLHGYIALQLTGDVSNFHLSFILMTQAAEDKNKQEKKMICVLCLEEKEVMMKRKCFSFQSNISPI